MYWFDPTPDAVFAAEKESEEVSEELSSASEVSNEIIDEDVIEEEIPLQDASRDPRNPPLIKVTRKSRYK